MVQFLGSVRVTPYTLSNFAHSRHHIPLSSSSSFPSSRIGFSPFRRILRACIQSNSCGKFDTQLPSDQPEIMFLGTGTSEGIPRLSCLTNPLKKCEVCSKAIEPGNKNKGLNTSILILDRCWKVFLPQCSSVVSCIWAKNN
ncbi:unnamed protein product [Linum trigynum]|uniref:Uncharacterized protein n=1 Tax=Linum trigynum TaxID=586398 RepID=A0AAV2FNZ9_9ROSI